MQQGKLFLLSQLRVVASDHFYFSYPNTSFILVKFVLVQDLLQDDLLVSVEIKEWMGFDIEQLLVELVLLHMASPLSVDQVS